MAKVEFVNPDSVDLVPCGLGQAIASHTTWIGGRAISQSKGALGNDPRIARPLCQPRDRVVWIGLIDDGRCGVFVGGPGDNDVRVRFYLEQWHHGLLMWFEFGWGN